MATDETIIQVKIRRNDIYDAVRNLLMNEFRVIPSDLSKVVEQKIDNKIKDAVDTAVYRTYGFSDKVQRAIDATVKKLQTEAEATVRQIIQDEVKRIVGEKVVQQLVGKILNPEAK